MGRRGFDEPNYTQTPNALFDVHLADLGYAELKVLLVVVRDTFGWHRKQTEPLTLSELVRRTGLSRESCQGGITGLLDRGMVTRTQKGQSFAYEAVITEQLALGQRSGNPTDRSGKPTAAPRSAKPTAGGQESRPLAVGLPDRPMKETKDPEKNPPGAPPEGGTTDPIWLDALAALRLKVPGVDHYLAKCRVVELTDDVLRLEGGQSADWVSARYVQPLREHLGRQVTVIDAQPEQRAPAPPRRRRRAA